MPDPAALAALAPLTLYPALDHRELDVSPYVHAVEQGPVPLDELDAATAGLDLRYRVVDTTGGQSPAPFGTESRVRFYRDTDGRPRLDVVSVNWSIVSLQVRPELGDVFDVSVGTGRFEMPWAHGDDGSKQYRVYSPISIMPIGVSNTDQDADAKVKYQIAASFGIGADGLARVVGPVGLYARADVEGRTARRFATTTHDNVRHEAVWTAEAGLAFLDRRRAWVMGAWGEHHTQWDPHDAEGRDGPDRAYVAGGVRVGARFYEPGSPTTPDEPVPSDFEHLLQLLQQQDDGTEATETSEDPAAVNKARLEAQQGTATTDETKPADDASKPADDTSKPADDASKPADDTSKPADDTSKPKDDGHKEKGPTP